MTGERASIFDHLTPSRYDLVLAAIPSVFVMAVLVGNLLSLPANVAVAVAPWSPAWRCSTRCS